MSRACQFDIKRDGQRDSRESHSSEHHGRSCEAALAIHVNFDEVAHVSMVKNSQMETQLAERLKLN